MKRSGDGAAMIDGSALAESIRDELRGRIAALRSAGKGCRLDALIAADDPHCAGYVYAKNQRKTCRSLGIDYVLHDLPWSADEQEILARVDALNADPEVHGVMVHMPLPDAVDTYRVQRRIDPDKDVEGVNPANIGNIVAGRSTLAPCTALAVMKLVEAAGVELRGRTAVVVGASDIVGKPVAVMLMRPEATVVSCNKFTKDITSLTKSADVLVAAAGVPGLVTAEWVKPGAVVIDVGIHRVPVDDPARARTGVKKKTIGDVDAASVSPVAGALTPVPGGVGPVTVAMLLHNVVLAAEGLQA